MSQINLSNIDEADLIKPNAGLFESEFGPSIVTN